MRKEQGMPDFSKNEEEILKFWDKQEIFSKLKEKNKSTGKYYATLDGPITANGITMGLHHAFGRSRKDTLIKYHALRGYDMHYQNGFDAQGLWVEVNAEKDLGLNSKKEIESYGIDKFTEYCMDKVNKCSHSMTEQSIRLGQWMNWDDSYYTNSDENITAIWHFLKVCNEKGWLIQKHRPMPWCTRCGTSLSEHEMSDSDAYRNDECQAIFFKLPIKEINAKMLVWTTTPWTLSSNVAIAVNPELDYAVCNVKSDASPIITLANAVKVLKDDVISIVKTVKGSELVGLTYETCFPELAEQQFEHKIVAWDQVDANEGCGAVHIAPGCGAEDFELGQSLNFPNVCPIDDGGIFYKNFGFLAGLDAQKEETRDLIFDRLKQNNKLYYTHKYTHRYPHCWRCKNPILFRLIKEWAISMDEIRPQLIEETKKVEWQPAFYEKRMLDWLNNMGDWSISRKRYYGLPLPFYVCPDCGKITVVGSLKELKTLAVNPEKVDTLPHLHRPYIDEIKIRCPQCNAEVERIKDVGDCWLDAGITPFSTNKYFTDREYWEKNYPAECVIEMKEQIRLWFYSLLVMGVTLTGKSPYKKVSTYASLLALDGKKLSKSSPNNIPLNTAFEKIGSDIIRYTFVSTSAQSDVIFSYDSTDEIRRKLLNLWNSYIFMNTYASLDTPDLTNYVPDKNSLSISDKWLIQRTNEYVKQVTDSYEKTEFSDVTLSYEKFIDELSNWYIRINRRRFWKGENGSDKLNAYFCLNYALKNILITLAPITPFMTEYIWQNLIRELDKNADESVMLSGYKVGDYTLDEKELISQTNLVRDIITLAQRLRNEKQIKVKQPLKTLYVCGNDDVKHAIDLYEDILKDELNIKNIEIVHDQSKFNDEYLTLDFRRAGAVLKGDVQKVRNALLTLSDIDMQQKVDEYKQGIVHIENYDLNQDLFVLNTKAKTDFVIANVDNITVVLDVTIDRTLLLEGLSRELIRTAQVLRKDSKLEVSDRIQLFISTTSADMQEVLEKYLEKIKFELLATSFEDIADPKGTFNGEIAGEPVIIKIK